MRSTSIFEGGVVVGLLDAEIDEAGDFVELVENLVGDLAVAGEVGAFELDVDGGRQAEVEDLGDDVRGQEVEGVTGEGVGELLAQGGDIAGGGAVIFAERDEDVGVTRAEEAGGGVLGVEDRVGEADVVEDVVGSFGGNGRADALFDLVAELGGFFNACAGRGADVQDEGAVVARGGKKLRPRKGMSRKTQQAAEQEERDEAGAEADERGEEVLVRGADGFETTLKAALKTGERCFCEGRGMVIVRLEQVHGEGGDQGTAESA